MSGKRGETTQKLKKGEIKKSEQIKRKRNRKEGKEIQNRKYKEKKSRN